MTNISTRPTRIHSDIVESANAVATREDRTTTEQVNHWARIGMQFERSASVDFRRVRAAAAGDLQFRELDVDERAHAHAAVDAAMGARVRSTSFGEAARASGQRTVSIDADGRLVEIDADGRQRLL